MKYEVIKNFKDKYTNERYEVGQIIELTSDRAKEILSVDKLIKKAKQPKKDEGVVE